MNTQQYYGRTIRQASLADDTLVLKFPDSAVCIYDDAQNCCERRYMQTDDEVQDLVGHELLEILLKPVEDISSPDSWDIHQVCFLEIRTTGGSVVFSNHNVHNGYYGGFDLCIEELLT